MVYSNSKAQTLPGTKNGTGLLFIGVTFILNLQYYKN
jgi:hypothetical protein